MLSLFSHISPAQKQVVLSGHRKTDESKPVQITRRLPNPNISVRGHVLLAVLFWSLFFAGVVLNIISYSQTPPVATQSLVYSDDADIPPLSVIISVECKESVCGDMLLSVNYSGFANSACLKPVQTAGVTAYIGSDLQQVQRKILFTDNNGSVMDLVMTQNQNLADSAKIFYVAPLCFTAQESMKLSSADPEATFPLSMIQVGFTNLTATAGAAMNVEVKWTGIGGSSPSSVASSSSASIKRLINVNEDHSVRVLPIYGTVEEDLDLPAGSRVLSFTPSADVIQFEGFRPSTTSKRSDVMIVAQTMMTLRKLEHIESVWDLVASVGSTFETLVGVFVVVIPIWVRLFASKSNWMSRLLHCGGDERSNNSRTSSRENQRSSTADAEMLEKTCSSEENDGNNNENEPKEDSPAIMANAHNDDLDPAEDDGNSYFQGEDGLYYCFNGAEYFRFSVEEGKWIPVTEIPQK